jgi:hypothetical protein
MDYSHRQHLVLRDRQRSHERTVAEKVQFVHVVP